jgi:lipopolysaccharide transport system permease protein
MNQLHFWHLVVLKVKLNLKSEASKSYLSYLWWLLEPALFVGVFFVVFGIFLANKTDGFIMFLLCGKIPFIWFSRTVGNAANSITGGRGLMNQMKIPKMFFPAVVITQDFVKSMSVFLLMLVVLWIAGYKPNLTWISLPVIIFTQLIFIMSIATIGSAIVPFLPDFRFIINTGLMLMMFASGIFYSYEDTTPRIVFIQPDGKSNQNI